VCYAFDRLALPVGPLERRTEATIVDPEALEDELADIRRRGWADTWEELEVGLAAVAAPVRSAGGTVVGALAISGPTARIPTDRLPRLAALVAEHASLVSTQLGYARKAGAA